MALDRFSIDDVRESFTADMAAKIRRVREAGQALISSSSLATPVAQDPVDGIPGFEAVSHACHAIFGTSALVDARSMAESARLIEILASVGRDTLFELEKQARIGRSLGEACVEGATALQHMLELELDHRGLEAWEVALAFRERMGRWEEARDAIAKGEPPKEFAFEDEPGAAQPQASPPSLHAEFSFEDEAAPGPASPEATKTPSLSGPSSAALAPWAASPPADPGEFSFEDERTEPPATSSVDPLAAELLEVFRQEAREGLLLLEGHLRALAHDPRDRGTLTALERIYHTLKGSAATVGLGRVSAMAADLQDSLQDALDRELDQGPGLAPEAVADLVTRTNSLLAAAELPTLESADGARTDLLATAHDLTAPPGAASAPAGVRENVTIVVPPEIWETYLEESADLLSRMERQILALEESPQPQAVLLELFRSYHTLKGSSHTVGLGPVARVVHRVEDFLEELASAPILPPLRHLATLLLNVQDDVRRGLKQAPEGFVETRLGDIEAEIESVRSGGPRSRELRVTSPSPASSGVLAGGAPSSGVISLTPKTPAAATPGPSSASPRRRFSDRMDAEDRRSVRVTQERLDGLMNLTGELVVGRSRLLRRVGRLRSMQRQLSLGHKRLVTTVDRFLERHEFSLAPTGTDGKDGQKPAPGPSWGAFSELEMDRYGDVNILARHLGTIADEVATVQAQMQEVLGQFADEAAGFGNIVSGLQGEITRARMVPVDELFSRLRLPVRDAAQREGKSVRVSVSGADVDLDKTIVDKLYVPLLHLVRNAVSHGIEPLERRGASGKDPVGTIALQARHESGLIVIEVSDDGGGLNLARLRDEAVKQGVLAPDVPLDHPSVAEAIFLPGVSTRGSTDELAGRGMGGDVVRREIEKLGGDVRVKSLPGTGTTFTISLPLTLAITRALLLRHGGQLFAVPLAFAERLLDLTEHPTVSSAGLRRIKLGDRHEPVFSLDEVLGRGSRSDDRPGVAVLLRAGERRMVVAVDHLIGQEEIVVKSLGELLTGHPLLSGVTLSGDGELILILDVPGLLEPRNKATGPEADASPEDLAPSGPVRVLFVDDSLSVRKVAETLLTDLGAEVRLAVDGQDALEILGRETVDLVFTDLEMPRLHGYELIQAISSSPALRHLPVVVVTSRSGQKHRDEARALGARDYVTKPFNQEVLRQVLRRFVPRSGRL